MNTEHKTVTAPHAGMTDLSGQILSLDLQPDEEVVWHWTHYPNGQSVVTGYEVRKKDEAK